MKEITAKAEQTKKETAPRLSVKCGKNTITFHNPNNEKDSQLIAEDFISRASQNVVKEYLLTQEKTEV